MITFRIILRGDIVRILQYVDMDSFIREITTDDVYKVMKEDEDIYDTSNYDPNSTPFSNKNKMVICKFKDKFCEKL